MPAFQFGPFLVGRNTLWLDAHGLLMTLTLMALAFLCGALWFVRQADARAVRGLRAISLVAFVALALLMFTGLVPDVRFEKGAEFSGTVHNEFGTFTSAVTDDNVAALTGPLLFDMMEHVSFVLPVLAALIAFLVWHHGRRVFEDATVRRSVQFVAAVTVAWVLAIGSMGVYVTKVLTFPFTR